MASDAFPLGAAVTLEQLDGDPHDILARLREREPVSWLPSLDGWLITRHDLALAAMRDAATFTVDDPRFSTAQVIGPSMLSLDGDQHARHRAPFVGPFRPAEVGRPLRRAGARRGRAADRRARARPAAASCGGDSRARCRRRSSPARSGWPATRSRDVLTLVRRDRRVGDRDHLGHGPDRGGGRRVREPARAPAAGDRRRGPRLAAGLRGRRLGPERGADRLQRRRPAVRGHRDDRGDDRQRAADAARSIPPSWPRRAPTPRRSAPRSRSRCGWSPRPP